MTACNDAFDSVFGGAIKEGDAVMFTTMVPDAGRRTRTAKDDWETEVRSYKAVNDKYTFCVEMYKEGLTPFAPVAESHYKPVVTIEDDESLTYAADGTLYNSDNAPLYWQDNVSKWGFKATAGTAELEADQTDEAKWLSQDCLVGYSYLPMWKGDEESGYATDNLNDINYRTSKEWYRDNQLATELSGIMVDPTSDDFKKIPLFMKHQRAWVTIILKAGEGVTREALAYETSADNIHTIIYSHKEGQSPLAITAWSREHLIDYDNDKNGDAATNVSTTRYDAIVEPHNFLASKESQEKDVIARISVSNQNFTFAAANDLNYANFNVQDPSEEAKAAMSMYNLEAGKHLTITATLSRASRMIMITAWIEDWTETVTQTICDDYGQNGDPILINNRKELMDFLTDPDMNKAGNVGMIVPNAMFLADTVWNTNDYTLKATLNLASAQITVGKQFLKNIERTGSVINGEICVADTFRAPAAIATTNHGTIERVRVTTDSETSKARASVAGMVDTNYGTIYQCSSALSVYGTSGYVGGIAAKNLYEDTGLMPVLDACTVTARVDGNESVIAGGGIVGQAEGRVSNNTFEYGITLLQNAKFQNVIGEIGTMHGLTTHENNAWPTTARYTVKDSSVEIVNRNTTATYDAVVDSEDELKTLLTSPYNSSEKVYRVANSFSVDKETWIWGHDVLRNDYFSNDATESYARGTVRFKLDGNDKTIWLTGSRYSTMLFGNIIGEVYDLNLLLERPLVADRIMQEDNSKVDTNTDAIAAFAYAVTGTGSVHGQIRNITLRAETTEYVEASTPGGIVVWASHGGQIVNCASNVPVRMKLTETAGSDARHYAGGIVAVAHKATITQCKYYADSGIGWSEEDENTKAKKNNCRYGGIVGGTSEISGSDTHPSLVLSDCYSWWQLPTFSEDVIERPYMGGIIGSTVYHDPNDATKLFNAMAEGNAGNWWIGTVGAAFRMSGVTEEETIGKKNSVVPNKPTGW